MSINALTRPALGQTASLATLYDARTDTFSPLSLLRALPPRAAVTKTGVYTTDVNFSRIDTYKEKFDNMGVNAELTASFLAGLISVEGSGRYLVETRDSNFVMQASLHYNITTVHEKLNFASQEVKRFLAFDALDNSVATHVVVEIVWGAESIVTAKHHISDGENRAELEDDLKVELEKLKLATISGDVAVEKEGGERDTGKLFEVTVYGDVLADDGILPTDFESAYKFIHNVPRYIARANGGKGKPLVYTLLPVNLLPFFMPLKVQADIPITQLSPECLEKFVLLFDEFRSAQQALNDYFSYVSNHRFCLPAEQILAVANLLKSTEIGEADLKLQYARILKEVRAGNADPQKLWQLLAEFSSGDSAPERIIAITHTYREKVEFLEMAIAKGAIYVGYNGLSIDKELAEDGCEDAYILYFNEEVRQEHQSWNGNSTLLLELLQDSGGQTPVFLVDCDAKGDQLEKAFISHRRNGQVVTKDVLEARELLADKCTIQYDEEYLDRSMTSKPIQRRPIRMPCPGLECKATQWDWICFRCHAPAEYGMDRYLYCDCGRSLYVNYDFKCKDPKHGANIEKPDQKKLLQLLDGLEPFKELNILILGETGVGKSTFINAFVNYLAFKSLDEALNADELDFIIPCSFATQYVDKTDRGGRLVQKEIKIGSSEDEHDGSTGKSATQKTNVYPVTIGTTNVRLIDTPGIGDTRGAPQDQKNMADILSVLRNYEKLHGILILHKPNNARLNVMFKFCIKELLTHLHRNAVNNMVFGFTNTRGSNYKPGDTFKPLEVLLREYQECDIGLFQHTVYCFDSESFRYLAARKQGIDMGDLDDYRRSWEKSAVESQRLLAHFQSLMPHNVKSTLNLNETRHLVAQLTKPMAEISKAIRRSIQVNEDEAEKLSDKKISAKDLMSKLHVQKVTLCEHSIDKPRTVCANVNCVDFKNDGVDEGEKQLRTVYKTLCHAPCYLTNVRAETIGCPELIHCAAFNKKSRCSVCGHLWQEHLHILYEMRPKTVTVKDKDVEKTLKEKGDLIKLAKAAIEAKKKTIEEYQAEHEQIKQAAVQFSLFLKVYSITPYNDATLEYLDFLIKEEKGKVNFGGSPKHLKEMEQYRSEYQMLIEVLTSNTKKGKGKKILDEAGVAKLIKELYTLKHYGENLRNIREFIEVAHTSTYREKPYRMRGRWTTTGSGSSSFISPASWGPRSPSPPPYSEISTDAYALVLSRPVASSNDVDMLEPGRPAAPSYVALPDATIARVTAREGSRSNGSRGFRGIMRVAVSNQFARFSFK